MDPSNNPVPTNNPAQNSGLPPVPPSESVVPVSQPATPQASVSPNEQNIVTNPGDSLNNFSSEDIVSLNGVSPTDPIMVPDPTPTPDPVEEELRSPMKAAAPAPGSIGSAVSGPELGLEPISMSDTAPIPSTTPEVQTQPATISPETMPGPAITDDFSAATVSPNSTPSVSFNDPAEEQNNTQNMTDGSKKKSNKTTLIALIIVACMVVIALATILVLQLMNNNETPTVNVNSSTTNQIDDNKSDSSKKNNDSSAGTNSNDSDTSDDAIVCTASQFVKDDLTLEIGRTVKSATATLEFADDKFTGASVQIMSTSEKDIDIKTTVKLTARQFFNQAGLSDDELVKNDISFDDDDNAEMTESQIMKILSDNTDGYTCVGSDQS